MKRFLAALLVLVMPGIVSSQWGQGQCGPVGPQYPQQAPIQADVPQWIIDASVLVVCADGCRGSGTCICVEGGCGLCITNSHVVSGGTPTGTPKSDTCTVKFPSGKVYQGRITKRDTRADLAAIVISGEGTIPYVPLSQTVPPRGTSLWQVGYPHGAGPTKRNTRVYGYAPAVANQPEYLIAAFDPIRGESGSGLFSQTDGRLCGVVWGGSRGVHCHAVELQDVVKFCDDVNIFSPLRRPQPTQPQPPGPPPAPPAITDPTITTTLAQHKTILDQIKADMEAMRQRHDALVTQGTASVGALEDKIAKIKSALDMTTTILQDLPAIKAQVNQLPIVQAAIKDIPGLGAKIAAIEANPALVKGEAIVAKLPVLEAAIAATPKAAEVAAVGAKVLEVEKLVAPGATALGPWAVPALALTGLGTAIVALMRNRQQTGGGGTPVAVSTPAAQPTIAPVSTLATTYGPLLARVEQNLLNAAASGIIQSHAGNPGSMKSAA